jgi:integrase
MTSAAIEAVNGIIQLAKRMARGFKNFVYFRTAAYHRAGNLQLAVPKHDLTPQLATENSESALFPSFGKNRETIESRRLDRRSVLKLVEKRARTSGILKRVCCHSFRATGVTEYMNSGGTIEIAQRIAGHTSPSTTRIYD